MPRSRDVASAGLTRSADPNRHAASESPLLGLEEFSQLVRELPFSGDAVMTKLRIAVADPCRRSAPVVPLSEACPDDGCGQVWATIEDGGGKMRLPKNLVPLPRNGVSRGRICNGCKSKKYKRC